MNYTLPVGRIAYYASNGSVQESTVFTSPDAMVKRIKEGLSCGELIGIVVYSDENGPRIPMDWQEEIDTQPLFLKTQSLPSIGKPQKKHPVDIQNDRIYFCDNLVGFLRTDTAVLDPMFNRDDLNAQLRKRGFVVHYAGGIYDRLMSGEPVENLTLKTVRIWQLKPGFYDKQFIPYAEYAEKFGEPDLKDYDAVYKEESNDVDLEHIFERFNVELPPSFPGHALSISDIVEIKTDSGSTFHYVDRFGYQKLDNQNPIHEPSMDP